MTTPRTLCEKARTRAAGLLCAWLAGLTSEAFAQNATTVCTAEALASGRTYNQGASVTYQPGPGNIGVAIGNGSFPPGGLTLATVEVDTGVTNSRFAGNYMNAGINALAFEIIGSGFLPETAVVELRCASGRRWRFNFLNQLNSNAGVPTQVVAPLQFSAGWTTPWPGEPHTMFAMDMQQVVQCSIVLMPGKPASHTFLPAQTYTLRSVRALSDTAVSQPLDQLSPLARALTRRFGYGIEREADLTPAMREVDLDQDSLKDFQEALAEHDSAFAASLLHVDIASTGTPLILRWPAVGGQTYRLMGSDVVRTAASPATRILEITPANTGVVQPVLPNLGDNLRYFWIEWEPSGYAE